MNNLILKFHPKQLAYYLNSDLYGIIPVETNLAVSGDRFREELYRITKDMNISNVIIEKPFLKLLGVQEERKTLAKHIIHVQRTLFGALLYAHLRTDDLRDAVEMLD
jgi:hypothetical protein